MEFKESEAYKCIIKECKDSNIMNKKAKFSCLVDGITEYHYVDDNVTYMFTFICDDDIVRKMEIEWILDLKRVSYFELEVLIRDESGDITARDSRRYSNQDIAQSN